VAARSKAWFSGRFFAGIADSNPAEGMDVCLLLVLCCQVEISASWGVLPSVLCLSMIWKPRKCRVEGPQKRPKMVKNVWSFSADRQDSAYRPRAFLQLHGTWRPCNYFSGARTEQGSHPMSRIHWTSSPWFKAFYYAFCRMCESAYIWITSLHLYRLYHQQWW
jgi:hypothetical protein